MIYVLTFFAGFAVGCIVESLYEMFTDEVDDDSQR